MLPTYISDNLYNVTMTIFTRRRRLFSTACIVVILVAAAHTAGHLRIYRVYQVPPPLVSLAVVTMLYAGSIRTTRA